MRDVEALIALCDSQVEFHSTFAAVGGMTIYHGHDGLRRWYRELEDVWGEVRLEAETYFDLGEHTLAFYVIHGRGRQSGEVSGVWASGWPFRALLAGAPPTA